RRGPARGHHICGARPGHRQQAPRGLVGRRARQDRRARVHHLLYSEAAAGPVRAQGPGDGDMILGRAFLPDATLGAPRYLSLLSPGGWSLYGLAAIVLFVVFPLLHLTVPTDSALHIRSEEHTSELQSLRHL